MSQLKERMLPILEAETNDQLTDSSNTEQPCADVKDRSPTLWRQIRGLSTLPFAIWRARRGQPQLPRVLTHTVTFRCNARCIMCDSWQLPGGDDLSLEEIRALYRSLPPMDVVRLTGGEPFVRNDFAQIADSAVRALKPFLLHVSSNGFLTKRVIEFCEQRNRSVPLELALSIDGVDGYHDRIRGNSNAWDLVWETLTRLVIRREQLNLKLVVNQTVADNDGLDQYALLSERLQPLGIEHHLVIAYAESATYSLEREREVVFQNNRGLDALATFDDDRLRRTLDLASQHASKLPWSRRVLRNYYLNGIRARLLADHQPRNPTCQALHTHLRVFPNGDIPVCQFNSRTIGNVRRDNWKDVWNGLRANEERKWVRRCQGCWAECEVAPSAIYTLDILAPNR